MLTVKKTPFEQAAGYLGGLKQRFSLPRSVTDSVCEIRLRAGQPVTLELSGGRAGKRRIRLSEAGTVTPEQIGECVREFCGYSVHSCEKQFREGWLTLEGGHRAGFTGTAVLKNGKVENVRDVSSVNLRIAKQYIGCADELYRRIKGSESETEFTGLLLIGRPMSAKTTVLRDLCRLISADYKVALIDERSEVAAVKNGIPCLDVGENTDVLTNFPKGEGIMTALRSLSPEYIFCDEIGWETAELTAMANSGVKTVLTAHSGDLQLNGTGRVKALLESGGISHIASLGYGKNLGRLESYGANRYCRSGENNGGGDFCLNGNGSGSLFFLPLENEGGITQGAYAGVARNGTAD